MHVNSFVKEAAGTDGLVTIFATPVKTPFGDTVGVIANFANSSWIELEFKNAYDNAKKGGLPYINLTMLNKKGQTIVSFNPQLRGGDTAYHHDFDAVLFKQNLGEMGDEGGKQALASTNADSAETIRITDGVPQVTAWAPVSNPKFVDSIGWHVMAQINSDDLLSGINWASRLYYGIGGSLLVLFVGIGWWFATKLVKELSSITGGITDAGDSVGSAGEQLSTASQQVSSGATEAASSLEETVASLEELTSMVRLNSDNASQAAALAQGSSQVAADGETEVRSLITSITNIAQSSRKIEDIINVIDDIAFQTNLLALNAAVEAARAGEQGKGFAVVAEAVRNLAQRSATAAKEISALIKDNVSKIDNGTKQADRSGAVLKEILTSVRKVADISNEIASASQEQSTGLAQISRAMNELDQATQRNAATSEEVAASSEELNSQAVALRTLVSALNGLLHGQQSDASRSASTASVERPKKPTLKTNRSPSIAFKASTKPKSPASRPTLKPVAAIKKSKNDPESIIPLEDEPGEQISSISGF